MAEPLTPAPPSMEAILASIKRIIDEPEPDGAAPAARAGEEEEDVLELGTDVAPAASTPPIPAPAASDEPPLVSAAARAASARAMATLATVAIDPAAGAHTLDGVVRELLRPMLKEWLDANLPDLVERVVAREIARLGGR